MSRKYQRELKALESRVSRKAWQFFRYGFGDKSLHDASLLSLRVGDGLGFIANGKRPFYLNRQTTAVVIEFLNYQQNARYVFDLRRVKLLQTELYGENESYARSIGHLYTYELSSLRDDLQLGFLFASGGTIVVQFRRMVFQLQRLKRGYAVEEMYR